jgi:hypothetical protein
MVGGKNSILYYFYLAEESMVAEETPSGSYLAEETPPEYKLVDQTVPLYSPSFILADETIPSS